MIHKSTLTVTIALALGASGACDDEGAREQAAPKGTSQESSETTGAAEKVKKDEKSVAETGVFEAELEEKTDEQYPDNPNIGRRSALHGSVAYERIRLERRESYEFDLVLVPEGEGPQLTIEEADISVYTPQAPEWIRESEYLAYIGLINQEWNRQQIHYRDRVELDAEASKWDAVTRVDVARNCLNAGLWEVIAYAEENGEEKPFYHGWFDFPEPLYATMFEDVNGIPYDEYEKPLEKWVEPENKPVDLSILRKVTDEQTVEFAARNDELYPKTGSRKTKYDNIVHPEEPETIQTMLEDDTRYASFAKPGIYDTEVPRKTKLGRLAELKKVTLRRTEPAAVDEPRHELELQFASNEGNRQTRLVLGGLDLDAIPRLSEEEHNQGYKMPMGVANHTFYATYEEATSNPVSDNPYFGMLFDAQGNWLDSHHIGIDGPLFHWDAEEDDVLHLYVLSYERHAFVGHYELQIPEKLREA